MKKYLIKIGLAFILVGLVGYASLAIYWPRSEPFRVSKDYLNRDPYIYKRFGESLELTPHVVSSLVAQDDVSGEARVPMTVKGSKASADIVVYLRKIQGRWVVIRVENKK